MLAIEENDVFALERVEALVGKDPIPGNALEGPDPFAPRRKLGRQEPPAIVLTLNLKHPR